MTKTDNRFEDVRRFVVALEAVLEQTPPGFGSQSSEPTVS